MTPRRATPADASALAATHIASWRVAYRGFFPDKVLDNLSLAESTALWAPRLASPDHHIWITGDPGRVTGFISACPSRDADAPPPAFAEIAALYVHPAAWGGGCGRALCETVFQVFENSPAQVLLVWVLTSNTRARHFYERLGFAPDDSRRDITLFNTTLPEMRYRRSLR